MKNRIESNPSQSSTWYSEASRRAIVMGPMMRKTPKRRSDPPPMRMARAIIVYAIKRFTGNPLFSKLSPPNEPVEKPLHYD
jgi:hypothetical protein